MMNKKNILGFLLMTVMSGTITCLLLVFVAHQDVDMAAVSGICGGMGGAAAIYLLVKKQKQAKLANNQAL